MKHVPKSELLALAREFLKLELLLAGSLNTEQLRKFLILARSLEESGGVAALKAVLHPEHTTSSGFSAAAGGSAVRPAPNDAAAAILKDTSRP
jgi:hypothetical protein